MKETSHHWFFPELLKLYFSTVSVTSLEGNLWNYEALINCCNFSFAGHIQWKCFHILRKTCCICQSCNVFSPFYHNWHPFKFLWKVSKHNILLSHFQSLQSPSWWKLGGGGIGCRFPHFQRFQVNLGVQFIASATGDIGTQFIATPFKLNEVRSLRLFS